MTKKQVNILIAILGVLVLGCVVLVVGAAWFATSVLHRQEADERTAMAAFDSARARFKDAPLFALRPGGPVLTRPVPESATVTPLHTVHVLTWDRDEQSLVQADLPFGLLRMSDGPINLANPFGDGSPTQRVVSIRVRDFERLGPALLMDQEMEDGHRLLIWTD